MASIHGETKIQDGILHAVVTDPAKGNTLSGSLMAEVVDVLSATGHEIRAVMITGAEGTFCSGGDVTAFASATNPGEFVGDLAAEFHTFIRALTQAPVPVIAAVEGWAAGAGMSIACVADVIVGGPSTAFLPAYPAIGLTPDGGMTWTLPRLIGFARARDLLLTNSPLRGEEAYRAGLITRFVDDTDIFSTATTIATQAAARSRQSSAGIKKLIWSAQFSTFDDQLDREAQSIAACAASIDGREGVRAFTERRRPNFTS
ncbi:enoyl-CoA hydratase/isomerase family protein [Rhodococcus opacus]|uniref:enoyl-CoA hydratase/isomerase family protein n=1 Tax=Rhodococcus opacus TaxID=37919 RepID=UPI0024BA8B39|nr:enoyl-CoA hydratase-related protein [Rhodococcus opacus]MDJ0418532.1 enoyl-CoA hydratase-related protein [Rhodococcus opacus]